MIRRAPRPDASFLMLRNEVIYDSRLSYKALGLLVFMLGHPDNYKFTRESLAAPGEREGVSAVRTGLAELEAIGYLVRTRSRHEDGTFTWVQTVYDTPQTISPAPTGGLPTDGEQKPSSDQWQESDQWPTIGGNPSDGYRPAVNVPSIEDFDFQDCKEDLLQESPSDSLPHTQLTLVATPVGAAVREAQPSFDDFWAIYPRKVGKQVARKAWANAIKRESPAVIVAGALRYRNDPNLPPVQYQPYPERWLNAGQWDDEPCPPRHVSSRPSADDEIRAALARADAMDAFALGS